MLNSLNINFIGYGIGQLPRNLWFVELVSFPGGWKDACTDECVIVTPRLESSLQ